MSTSCDTGGGGGGGLMMDFFPANFFPGNHVDNEVDENHHNHHHHPPGGGGSSSFSSLLPPHPSSCSPQDFHHGISPMLGKRSMSYPGIDIMCNNTTTQIVDQHNNNNNNNYPIGDTEQDNLSDDGSQLLLSGSGEKKRRLNVEQVKTLEKNFELGNKLEPERKIHLARALGLQPRQVAIWFQNRRARWKTKQLEKDYDVLKRQFDNLKADNDALHAQNQKLHSEILTLRGTRDQLPTESINLNKETDQGSCSNTRSDNSTASEIKFDISNSTPTGSPLSTPPTTTPTASMVAFFPPAAVMNNDNDGSAATTTMAHFFHNNNNNSRQQQQQQQEEEAGDMLIHCQAQKFEQQHHHHQPKEENFTSMFVGMDDVQPGFWPWIEHQPTFN